MKFQSTLHVGAPNIGDRERFHKYVDDIFDRRWLTNRGQLVQEFEARLCDYLNVKHCITMCNGTVALEIAAKALGLNGEVIVPSFTFVATAHALQWQEIKPVFCDISPDGYNLNPSEIERHITPKTTGIMGVHTYGRPCDIDALKAIADRHGLKLLFDAAHAFGCSYKGRMIGNFGNCEVFSFHATKFFNTFEGGAIATNDDALAEKVRLMQNFGFAGMDDVIYIGTNGKMSEMNAAMGLVNLDSLEDFIAHNRSIYELYKKCIRETPGLKLLEYAESDQCNYQYIVVEVSDDYPISRDALLSELHGRNILARRYFWPGCHQMEPYRTLQPEAEVLLPKTEWLAKRLIVLPTGTSISPTDIQNICSALK